MSRVQPAIKVGFFFCCYAIKVAHISKNIKKTCAKEQGIKVSLGQKCNLHCYGHYKTDSSNQALRLVDRCGIIIKMDKIAYHCM